MRLWTGGVFTDMPPVEREKIEKILLFLGGIV